MLPRPKSQMLSAGLSIVIVATICSMSACSTDDRTDMTNNSEIAGQNGSTRQDAGSRSMTGGNAESQAGQNRPMKGGTLAGAVTEPQSGGHLQNPGGAMGHAVDTGGTLPSGGQSTAELFSLSINNGFGSGRYPAGQTVHIWANIDPMTELLKRWTGDTAVLTDTKEWRTTLTMPARDIELNAERIDSSIELTKRNFQGRDRRKTVRYYIPDNPVGIVHMAHGTGGNGTFIEKLETWYVVRTLVNAGYAVWSTEAEEVDVGDRDGNNKIRWNANTLLNNPDVENIAAILDAFAGEGLIPSDLPRFAIGMSNGGAFSITLGAALNLSAVVSYCASGRAGIVEQTMSPTAWFLCENDDNAQVDNERAAANHSNLVAREVSTERHSLSASPLYDERFQRISGIDLDHSIGIASELRRSGHVNADGFFIDDVATITAAIAANPGRYPTFNALSGRAKLSVGTQVKIMRANHAMYSDFAHRTLVFIQAHTP